MGKVFIFTIVYLISIIYSDSFEWNPDSNEEYCFTDAIHQSLFSLVEFQELWSDRIEHAVENNLGEIVGNFFEESPTATDYPAHTSPTATDYPAHTSPTEYSTEYPTDTTGTEYPTDMTATEYPTDTTAPAGFCKCTNYSLDGQYCMDFKDDYTRKTKFCTDQKTEDDCDNITKYNKWVSLGTCSWTANTDDNGDRSLNMDENRGALVELLDASSLVLHEVLSLKTHDTEPSFLELVHSYLQGHDTCEEGHFCRSYVGPHGEEFDQFIAHFQTYMEKTQLPTIITNTLNTMANAKDLITKQEIKNWINIGFMLYEHFVFYGSQFARTSCYEFDSCTEVYEELNIWELLQFFEDVVVTYKSENTEYGIQLLFGDILEDMNDKDLPKILERLVFYAFMGEFPESEQMIKHVLNCMFSDNTDETPEFCHQRECKRNPDCGEAKQIRQAHTHMKMLNKVLFGDEDSSISYIFSQCIYIDNNCFEVIANGLQQAYTEPIELTENFLPEGTLDLVRLFKPEAESVSVVMKEMLSDMHKRDIILNFSNFIPISEEILEEVIPENFYAAKEIELLLNLGIDYAKVLDTITVKIDCQSSTEHLWFNWDLKEDGKFDNQDIEEFLTQMLYRDQALEEIQDSL